ncbi:hypothetical protein HK405_007087 [Cladochytrium tenue]|nr:hypothetical protein HK405_007087 [Cladochytrium tenue]
MSNRKAASSSAADSSSGNGGAGSGASASSSAGASASSGVTAMSASGDGATTSSTADSASSSTSSSVSSDALVASSATASTATSAPTTSTATASSSSCSQTQVDAFTSSTNLLGFTTGDDGTMKSLSRSSGQLVFVPTSSSYFYESLRNDDGGSSSTCGAAVTPFNYLVFTITGSGSAEVDIKTGCSENDHYTSSFAVSSSAATYAVDVEATVGSSALAADVSAFTWESFKLSSSSAQWTVTGVYFVNDLSACGISATVIS